MQQVAQALQQGVHHGILLWQLLVGHQCHQAFGDADLLVHSCFSVSVSGCVCVCLVVPVVAGACVVRRIGAHTGEPFGPGVYWCWW